MISEMDHRQPDTISRRRIKSISWILPAHLLLMYSRGVKVSEIADFLCIAKHYFNPKSGSIVLLKGGLNRTVCAVRFNAVFAGIVSSPHACLRILIVIRKWIWSVARSDHGSKAGQVDCTSQETSEIIQTLVVYRWHDSMADKITME